MYAWALFQVMGRSMNPKMQWDICRNVVRLEDGTAELGNLPRLFSGILYSITCLASRFLLIP